MSLKIHRWRHLRRHPAGAEYPDITGPEWAALVAEVKEFGVLNNRKVILHQGAVIDGWQLYRACLEAGIKPKFERLKLPADMPLEKWVEVVNDGRRHETAEVREQRAALRRQRIAEGRAQGKSIRTLAEEEGVHPKTVERDLEKVAPGVAGATPATVTGRDGKTYAAVQPSIIEPLKLMIDVGRIPPKLVPVIAQLDRNHQAIVLEHIEQGISPTAALNAAQQPDREVGDDDDIRRRPFKSMNGKPIFDLRKFESVFGALFRQVGDIGRPFDAINTPEAKAFSERLWHWHEDILAWQKSLAEAHRNGRASR